jgi:hypothetical protein
MVHLREYLRGKSPGRRVTDMVSERVHEPGLIGLFGLAGIVR